MSDEAPTYDDIDSEVEATVALLQMLVADRGLLAEIPTELRVQLLSLAGDLYEPDLTARRRLIKDQRRSDKNEKTARHQRISRRLPFARSAPNQYS